MSNIEYMHPGMTKGNEENAQGVLSVIVDPESLEVRAVTVDTAENYRQLKANLPDYFNHLSTVPDECRSTEFAIWFQPLTTRHAYTMSCGDGARPHLADFIQKCEVWPALLSPDFTSDLRDAILRNQAIREARQQDVPTPGTHPLQVWNLF